MMKRTICRIAVLAMAATFGGGVEAQSTAPELDKALTATRPILRYGSLTGRVVSARTTGCRTVLTLDNRKTFGLDLTKMPLAVGATLNLSDMSEFFIDDGLPIDELRFQGSGGEAAASAAEQIFKPLSVQCAKSVKPAERAFDLAVAASRPTLEAGKIKGRVSSAQTVDCASFLLLADGSTYVLDLAVHSGVAGPTLLNANSVEVTFATDELARAAGQSLAPLSKRCLASRYPLTSPGDEKKYAALGVQYADAFKSYNATVLEEQAAVANEKAGRGDRAITCSKIKLATDELELAQDILKQMIGMVDEAGQDDAAFRADLGAQDAVLQKWRANKARACTPAEPTFDRQTVQQKMEEIHSLTAGITDALQSAVTYGNMGARPEACRASHRAGEQLDRLDADVRDVSAAMRAGGYTDAERSQWAETADKAAYWSKSEREVAITDWRNAC